MGNRDAVLPGARVGVMGGGQLGRMFAIAARRMGYRVHVFSPERDAPAGQLADVEVVAPYDDLDAAERFARGVEVMTFEFENVPSATVSRCAEWTKVRPSANVLHIAQERLREKRFLAKAGLPVAPFRAVATLEALRDAAEAIGLPAVLKSAAFGYDGKGQRKVSDADDLAEIWAPYEGTLAVLEGFVRFEKELSVLVARGAGGEINTYPVCENLHHNHILDFTIVPARIDESVASRARELAITVAETLELEGLLAVEMFLCKDGEVLINELAPRPHNSGHFSFDACVTSQFEQQLRAVCGLPLGNPELLRPVAMVNLLGDLWADREPDWRATLALPDVKLHLYGKETPRPGRKMGHLVAFGADVEAALELAREARARL